MIDYLCDECKEHFEAVKARLDVMGLPYTVNPNIVRGLDYYTKTVFEFVSNDLGSQSAACGGGRYDGLIEQLGGSHTPGLGFAMGLERLLMIMEAQGIEIPKPRSCELYLANIGETAGLKAFELTQQLRSEGFCVECDTMGRGLKAQMKYADKLGAKFSMVLGDNELAENKAKLKNMETGETKEVALDQLSDAMYDAGLDKLLESIEEK